jgi:hypothetical protein
MEDRGGSKSAGALAQLRMHSDASRKGVSEEFTCAKETQTKRAVASMFKGSK